MNTKPTVFISYSHDSYEHKQWAAKLGNDLAARNIIVKLDQWDLHFGAEMTRFMERGITESDRVLMICSDNYVKKANDRRKGAGYEGMIVTAELFDNLDTIKFIPIIVNQSGPDFQLPTFLGSRLAVDFRDQTQYEAKLAELADDIREWFSVQTSSSPLTVTPSAVTDTNIGRHYANVGALIFAAGKSARMQTGRSKMLEQVTHNGVKKPMLAHTVDLYHSLNLEVLILVGFDGESVIKMVQTCCPAAKPIFLRVASDDGSDLEKNTGGTLRKYAQQILERLTNCKHILLSVGDQPHMDKRTIEAFIVHHLRENCDSCILTAYAKGTELEKCTSTRVSITPDGMEFNTPVKGLPFNYQAYSFLVDVGLVLIKKACFNDATERLQPNEVFGRIVLNTKQTGHFVESKEPVQFLNINEPICANNGGIILKWLEWNVHFNRKAGLFDIFQFGEQYEPDFELDTTLRCHTTPACAADCTYRMRHQTRDLDVNLGIYIIDKAKAIGYAGVLFSGGGECLEPAAYDVFLTLLKYAKTTGLRTYLATNGIYISDNNVGDLISHLDSVRVSIAAKAQIASNMDEKEGRITYSHLGVVGESISKMRRTVDTRKSGTKVWANLLMSAEMHMDELRASVLMLSQLGVDGIRLKAKHIPTASGFVLNARLFEPHVRTIQELKESKGAHLPEIAVSKIDRLLREPLEREIATYCWYGDFNPLVVGCDGRNYACCEMKYDSSFECGQFDPKSDNFRDVLTKGRPKRVLEPKCFTGCKGCLINRDLEHLLGEYRRSGKAALDLPANKEIHDRALKSIKRSSLYN